MNDVNLYNTIQHNPPLTALHTFCRSVSWKLPARINLLRFNAMEFNDSIVSFISPIFVIMLPQSDLSPMSRSIDSRQSAGFTGSLSEKTRREIGKLK